MRRRASAAVTAAALSLITACSDSSGGDHSEVVLGSDFMRWAGRQLPTEAQWERAAGVDDERAYPWGNDLPTAALANSNDVVGDTTEVGSYPDGASPYGALDMAGNVTEWTSDFFDGQSTHVLKGGSWTLDDASVRIDFRGTHPSAPNLGIGFRCALTED